MDLFHLLADQRTQDFGFLFRRFGEVLPDLFEITAGATSPAQARSVQWREYPYLTCLALGPKLRPAEWLSDCAGTRPFLMRATPLAGNGGASCCPRFPELQSF
jgi:hypothetical protein